MPIDPVNVNVDVANVPAAEVTYGQTWVFGTSTDSSGTISDETAKLANSLSEFGIYFGSGSKMHEMAEQVFTQGADSVGGITATGSASGAISNAANVLKEEDVDIVVSPFEATAESASAEALASECDTYDWIFSLEADLISSNVSAITSEASTINSKRAVLVADKDSSEDYVAPAVAGRLAVIEPWDKLMWKALSGVDSDTILSGDVTSLESGNVNAVIEKLGDTVISNGLTTAGGNYQFIDITRTERYVKNRLDNELTSLVKNAEVPYTQEGLGMVRDEIDGVLSPLVGDAIRSGYTISIPSIENIPESDIGNRILKNVQVQFTLAGRVQEITVDMTINLA